MEGAKTLVGKPSLTLPPVSRPASPCSLHSWHVNNHLNNSLDASLWRLCSRDRSASLHGSSLSPHLHPPLQAVLPEWSGVHGKDRVHPHTRLAPCPPVLSSSVLVSAVWGTVGVVLCLYSPRALPSLVPAALQDHREGRALSEPCLLLPQKLITCPSSQPPPTKSLIHTH